MAMELKSYDFWDTTNDKYKTRKCPHCKHDMGVKLVGDCLCWLCENCPLAINLDENEINKNRIKKSIQLKRRKKRK